MVRKIVTNIIMMSGKSIIVLCVWYDVYDASHLCFVFKIQSGFKFACVYVLMIKMHLST